MSDETTTPTTGDKATACDCPCVTNRGCGSGPRWGDPRLKRLFYATFIVGAGIGSMATSLAFGFYIS